MYPNGGADVNHFHAAGGLGVVIRELIDAGLLHPDIACVHGGDLRQQAMQPELDGVRCAGAEPPSQSLDTDVVRGVAEPFDSRRRPAPAVRQPRPRGGQDFRGRAGIRTIAHRHASSNRRMPCSMHSRPTCWTAISSPWCAARGRARTACPNCTSSRQRLAALQDRGQRVALLTDGRMSGASGKVLAAIHVTPEAVAGGSAGQAARRRHGPDRCRSRPHGCLGRCRRMGRAQPRPGRDGEPTMSAMAANCSHRCVARSVLPSKARAACSSTRLHRRDATMSETLALVGDIGGTNARFALTDLASPRVESAEAQSLTECRLRQHAARRRTLPGRSRRASATRRPGGGLPGRHRRNPPDQSRVVVQPQRTAGAAWPGRTAHDQRFRRRRLGDPGTGSRTSHPPCTATPRAIARTGQRARSRHRTRRRACWSARDEHGWHAVETEGGHVTFAPIGDEERAHRAHG